jgi:hypothetical protein
VEWAIGLAEPNAYYVPELQNPARILIDIKHKTSAAFSTAIPLNQAYRKPLFLGERHGA